MEIPLYYKWRHQLNDRRTAQTARRSSRKLPAERERENETRRTNVPRLPRLRRAVPVADFKILPSHGDTVARTETYPPMTENGHLSQPRRDRSSIRHAGDKCFVVSGRNGRIL